MLITPRRRRALSINFGRAATPKSRRVEHGCVAWRCFGGDKSFAGIFDTANTLVGRATPIDGLASGEVADTPTVRSTDAG